MQKMLHFLIAGCVVALFLDGKLKKVF